MGETHGGSDRPAAAYQLLILSREGKSLSRAVETRNWLPAHTGCTGQAMRPVRTNQEMNGTPQHMRMHKILLGGLVAIAAIATPIALASSASAATHTGSTTQRTADTSLTAKVVVSDVTSTQGGTRGVVDVYYSYAGRGLTLDSSNWVEIASRNGYYFELPDLSYVSPTHQRATFLVKGTDPIGTYDVSLSASAEVSYYDSYYGYQSDYDYLNTDNVTAFTVHRATGTTINVTPEPVKRNHYTHATGHVSNLVPYNYGLSSHYVSATGGRVHIYFDPTGSAAKRYIGSAAVNSHGNYSKLVKVTAAGTWSASYIPASSAYAGSTSAGDYVGLR